MFTHKKKTLSVAVVVDTSCYYIVDTSVIVWVQGFWPHVYSALSLSVALAMFYWYAYKYHLIKESWFCDYSLCAVF